MIQAKDVSFEYFRRDAEGNVVEVKRALDGINLRVKPGSFVAVLGANGSGKSTFAKHLNALLTPAEGVIYVDGKDTSDPGQELAVRKTAGMVFQNPDNQIIAGIVQEDVGFGPENIGVPTEEIWKRVENSLKSVGMYAYRESSPNHLSGGQKQRVAIAGIMAMKPKCIILDEPTAMLDPQGRRSVLQTAHQLNKEEQITVILITHYMEEVVNADYVYVMGDGQVRLEGTPRQIFAEPAELERWRLGVPEITKIAFGLHSAGVPVPMDVLDAEELAQWLLEYRKGR
ncbi:MAG: energy-coupling factor transporter ATPase [Eubacteriales bacterium]|nr:energy-coupling factor transporter ATPase [Eubacteriales bacterium]